MAKKTVKKSVKAPAKKAVTKAVPVPKAVAAVPVCTCGKCGLSWKKVFIFILGIAVGAVATCVVCKKCCNKRMWKKGGHEMMFKADGCLDLDKIKDPAKLEMIIAKVGNKDCITKADMFGGEKPQGPRRMRRQRRQAPTQ